jgi:hypothetical protein
VFQLDVQGSCNGRTTGMSGEAAMVKLWEGVSKAVMVETHKAQEGAFGGV